MNLILHVACLSIKGHFILVEVFGLSLFIRTTTLFRSIDPALPCGCGRVSRLQQLLLENY